MISAIKTRYDHVVASGTAFQSFLLLVIRLYWGYSFLMAGLGKLDNIPRTSDGFEGLGIYFPYFNAYAVAYIEAIGGACLLFGFATRLVTIPLVVVMIVALFKAHFSAVAHVWNDPQQLLNEAAFQHLFACLLLFSFGPGIVSFDSFLERFV